MALRTFVERSIAKLDYPLDWSDWLAAIGDTIATSTWQVTPAGMTVVSDTVIGGMATVWLSGGKPGESYRVQNTITTVGGRKDARTFLINIERSF